MMKYEEEDSPLPFFLLQGGEEAEVIGGDGDGCRGGRLHHEWIEHEVEWRNSKIERLHFFVKEEKLDQEEEEEEGSIHLRGKDSATSIYQDFCAAYPTPHYYSQDEDAGHLGMESDPSNYQHQLPPLPSLGRGGSGSASSESEAATTPFAYPGGIMSAFGHGRGSLPSGGPHPYTEQGSSLQPHFRPDHDHEHSGMSTTSTPLAGSTEDGGGGGGGGGGDEFSRGGPYSEGSEGEGELGDSRESSQPSTRKSARGGTGGASGASNKKQDSTGAVSHPNAIASSNGGGSQNSKNKRKASSQGQQDEDHKKKRNRAVLSCKPCKVRKIKCDRLQPCSSCIKRNMADECQWEDPSKIVDVQPFATAVEVEDIRNRLESVESLLAHIPPEVLRAAESASPPPAQTPRGLRRLPSTSTHISFRNNAAFLHEPHDVHSGTGGNSEAELENDGEEAAVGALEELALGQRSGPSWMAPSSDQDKNSNIDKTGFIPLRPVGPAERALYSFPDAVDQVRTQSTILLRQSPVIGEDHTTEFLRDMSSANQIRQVLKALPRRHITVALVRFYDDEMNWVSKAIYMPYFHRELEEFWEYVEKGVEYEMVDPAWLALLFSMMALSARAMPEDLLAGEDASIRNALPGQFHRAAQVCLNIAQWSYRPQIRVIQTLALSGIFVWFSANRNEGLVLLGGAFRIAQLLGLHMINPDKEDDMPKWDDLSFPTGPSSLKRQMCLRIWAHLTFLDSSYWSQKDKATFRPVTGAFSPHPLNCNDDELGLNIHVDEKPSNVMTDMSFDALRWRMADIWKFTESQLRRSYDDILAQDAAINQIIQSVPPEMVALEVDGTTRTRKLIWNRSLFYSGIHTQIIRLHRPFFYKSFKNIKYAASHAACIKASIAVVNANALMTVVSKQERFWFLFVHLFGATICLLLDLLHSVDAEVPTAKMLVEERIQQVLKAAETFRYAKDTAKMPGTARIGHIGETLINTTISAAKERQALSPKTRAKESYAETFKRITAAVQATAQGSDEAIMIPHYRPSPATQASMGGPGDHATYPVSNAIFARDAFATDPGTQELLRSLGLSLDGLIVPSPQDSIASGSHLLPTTDSVFDDLFNSSTLLDTSWPLAQF